MQARRYVLLLTSLLAIQLCGSLPLESPQNANPNPELERRHHNHHHHRHRHGNAPGDAHVPSDTGVVPSNAEEVPSNVDDELASQIARLRELDAIIGRVEEAAASRVSLDVDLTPEELEEFRMQEEEEEPFKPVALPRQFSTYDLDNDHLVTQSELSHVTGTSIDDATEPFHRADVNGDGFLTEDELLNAPWVFNMNRVN